MKKIVLILIVVGVAQAQNFWEQTNGPLGGSAFGIAENALNEIIVGTGIPDSRIYRSSDGGQTWIKSDSGMSFLEPNFILMNSRGYLYTNGYGSGTYRSITNGRTWEELPGIGGINQTSCLYIKENDYIYVGISDAPPYRIVKSTDDGETWIDISGSLDRQVEAITSIGDILYIATLGLGFYKSTDDGETWIDLSAFNNSWITGLTKNLLGELFAAVESSGLLKSTDGGISWVDICPGFYRCHTILTDVMGFTYIAGRREIKKSSDGGNTWVNVNSGIYSNYGESFYITQAGALYFSTLDAGIFKSTNSGDSWKQIGFNNSRIYDITFDEQDNIYVTTSNKVYKSTDYGNYWIFSGNGMANSTEVIHFAGNGYLWTGCNWASVHYLYYSSDKGVSWNPVPFGQVASIDNNSLNDLFIAAGDGLYISSNNGLNWTLKRSGAYGSVFIDDNDDNDDNDDIYYGHHNLEHSTDNGETWTTLLTNHGSDDIYVDNYGNIFSANNYYGLLRSTDMGTTWDTLSHNFVGERILVITGNSTNQLFCSAGTYGQFAVYMSDDIGENWIDVTSGFHSNRTVCTSLAFDSRGFIYAGTNYYSVFRSVLTTVGIGKGQNKLPSEYLLEQNYPNPFNPVTSIQYSLPYSGFVIITVYDMLGRKVAFLVNEEKPAGNYEVDFSAKGLASGVYIYRMKVNDPETGSGQDFIQSKKMMLIK